MSTADWTQLVFVAGIIVGLMIAGCAGLVVLVFTKWSPGRRIGPAEE